MNLDFYDGAVPDNWTEIFVSGVEDDGENCIQVSDDEADFWSIYIRDDKGYLSVIADLPDRSSAVDLAAVIEAVASAKKVLTTDN